MAAEAKNLDLHLNSEFTTNRARKGSYINYTDILGNGIFKLAIDTADETATGFVSSLSISKGLPDEISESNLDCSISGVFTPRELQCPEASKLNEKLLEAVKYSPASDVNSLLECGADADFKDSKGCTPLLYVTDFACGGYDGVYGNRSSIDIKDVLGLLIDKGATVEARDPKTQRTALLNLTTLQFWDAMDLLFDSEADVNAQDQKGFTSVMIAADRGSEMTVRTLLRANPDLKLKNKAGLTAYAIAQKKGYEELLDLLVPAAQALIEGQEDGTCTPDMVHLSVGKTYEVVLKATSGKMFLLTSPDLSIELMAMPGESKKMTFTPKKTGTFPFECGVHGSSTQTKGSFMVM